MHSFPTAKKPAQIDNLRTSFLCVYQNEMKQGLQSKDFLDNFHRIFNAARTSAEHGSGINAL